MAAAHTPTPWYFDELRGNDGMGYVCGPADEVITHHGDHSLSQGINQANAAFIVRACNAHEELVEAARTTVRVAEAGPVIERNKPHYVKARAALAQAKAPSTSSG